MGGGGGGAPLPGAGLGTTIVILSGSGISLSPPVFPIYATCFGGAAVGIFKFFERTPMSYILFISLAVANKAISSSL